VAALGQTDKGQRQVSDFSSKFPRPRSKRIMPNTRAVAWTHGLSRLTRHTRGTHKCGITTCLPLPRAITTHDTVTGNVSGLTPGTIKRQSLPTPKMAG